MKLYKLTEQNKTTYHGKATWDENVTHSLPEKENPQLCSEDVLHAYSNVNLAFLLNPIHANITRPLLWEAEGEVVTQDFGKVGCFQLTTIKQVEYPSWVGSDKERQVQVAFSVLCAEAVLSHFEGKYPADKRVREAIEAAKAYLINPEGAACAAGAAACAAGAAACAAGAAACAAAWAAEAAAWAAWAAEAAAGAAAWAAWAAACAAGAADSIDFGFIADEAVRLIMEK